MWIDHRKAMIASVTEKGEEMGLVISKAESQPRRTGGSPLKGRAEPEREPMPNAKQRKFTGHLNIYYDAVIAALLDARSILHVLCTITQKTTVRREPEQPAA